MSFPKEPKADKPSLGTALSQTTSGAGEHDRLKSYITLDMWRGIASLWVVMAHASPIITQMFPHLRRVFIYVIGSYGTLGVQMFFVISGYCIANAAGSAVRHDHGFWQFMRARARRIYPTYWIALLFYASLASLTSLLVTSGRLKSSILGAHDPLHQPWLYSASNLTLTQDLLKEPSLILVSWTLCYEVFFYLIIGIILFFCKRKGEPAMLSVLHGVTAVALLLLILAPQCRSFPLDMWPQFGLGVVAYDYIKHPTVARPKWAAFAIGVLIVIFIARWSIPIGTQGESSRLTYFVALIFCGVILLLHKYDEALSRNRVVMVFSWIGLFSYSLYLVHVICLGLLNQLVKKTHLPQGLAPLWFLTSLLLPIGVARLFYHFCERPYVKSNRAARLEPVVQMANLLSVEAEPT